MLFCYVICHLYKTSDSMCTDMLSLYCIAVSQNNIKIKLDSFGRQYKHGLLFTGVSDKCLAVRLESHIVSVLRAEQ